MGTIRKPYIVECDLDFDHNDRRYPLVYPSFPCPSSASFSLPFFSFLPSPKKTKTKKKT
jgi:hypothetical protein